MQVKIKDLSAEIELKNNGIELEIRDTAGNFLGDLIISRTQIIWCKGKTKRSNGKKLTLQKFIEMMEGSESKPVAKRPTKKAAAAKTSAPKKKSAPAKAATAKKEADEVAPAVARRARRRRVSPMAM